MVHALIALMVPGSPLSAVRRWPGTASVASMKAVLLELTQTDMEELVQNDAGLSESVGETIRQLGLSTRARAL